MTSKKTLFDMLEEGEKSQQDVPVKVDISTFVKAVKQREGRSSEQKFQEQQPEDQGAMPLGGADSKRKSKNSGKIQPESQKEISDKEFIAFIGIKADKYLAKFERFRGGGNDKFLTTWNWAAFLANFWWALYRKLYFWALIMFILDFIPIVNFIFALIFGMSANYIYYRHAKRKILKLRGDERETDEGLDNLRKEGGVNGWVPVTAVIVAGVSISGIIVAVSIPQYYEHYNSIARSALRDAVTAQELYYLDHKTYAHSTKDLLVSGWLTLPEGVGMEVITASKQSYVLLSYHKKGNEGFIVKGPEGSIMSVSDVSRSITSPRTNEEWVLLIACTIYDTWRNSVGKQP